MTPVQKEHVDQVRSIVHEILAKQASDIFLARIDKVLEDWAQGTLTAVQACDKVQKTVSLFVSEDLAKEIVNRCAMIVMRESATKK
jgi:hypothetical protein